jgi:hypothetical protein
MRYSLWSHGRLLGHTELDIHTVTPTMRQGFVEPTPQGKPLLEDATGVWRAMAQRMRAIRQGGDEAAQDDLVTEAMNRREALDLELRDANGEMFECEYIRIYDLLDTGVVDDMEETEEEAEAAFEIYLSGLAPTDRAEVLAQRAAADAEVEEFVAEMTEELNEREMFGSGWPPEDPRWETMQYHLQVHLKGCFDKFADSLDFGSAE